MRTVTYKSVLDGFLRTAGEVADDPNDIDAAAAMEFLDQALSAAHEFWRWPELVLIEKRFFRPTYDNAETYAAGAEVYFPQSQLYYRALRATLGNAPANSEAAANNSYWAELGEEITGDDWAASTAYAVGDTARRLSDGAYYMCHTGHTSAGSFDTSKFGLLAEFRPYIAYEQDDQTAIEAVLECYNSDPRSDPGALKVPFRIDGDGVRFAADQDGPLWIEFRKRCPAFTWQEWSGTNWAADSQVYHATTGEIYRASSAANSTDVPGTAALWVKQDVPYIFRHAAKLKALGLWLEADGQTDKALVYDNPDPAAPGKFQNALEEQVWQYTKLQGQTGRVQTLLPAR